MPYLLDSDWVVDHLADVPEARQLLDKLSLEGIAVSIVTYLETYEGVERSPNRAEAESKFQSFMREVPVLPVSPGIARRCAQLRHTLRKQGKRVERRALDLIIAATALEHNLSLVTRNVEDYEDVPGLKIYPSGEAAGKS
jgi:predicted nucleic acid-binding protein